MSYKKEKPYQTCSCKSLLDSYKEPQKLTSIFESRVLEQIERSLNCNEVKYNTVFVCIVNFTNCKQNIPLFWECLSTKEKIQAKQYYTSDLSDRYIISHGILRYILSYYTHQLPRNIEFIHNKYDKIIPKKNLTLH